MALVAVATLGGIVGWNVLNGREDVPNAAMPTQTGSSVASEVSELSKPSVATEPAVTALPDLSDYVWKAIASVVGKSVGNEKDGNVLMADVVLLPDGTYRMYYNAGGKGTGSIKFANSVNGDTWTAGGTALQGGSSPTDDDYIIGGSRVLQLKDGSYRMYYRATPEHEGSIPSYSVYMAQSDDGKTFTKYGVVIPNTREDAASTLVLAGHGAFYQMEDETFAGFVSGNAVASNSVPSDLFFTTSADGVSWKTPTVAYVGYHDPTVVKTSDGYFLLAMYLKKWVGIGFSADGIDWSVALEPVELLGTDGKTADLQPIGDLSTVVAPDGSLLLFSNYGNPGDRSIMRYVQQ